jgi:tripartite ATP-independent transporter DctM subunit
MFMAGVGPGLLIGGLFCVYVYFKSRRRGWKSQRLYTRLEAIQILREGIWGLLLPVVVLGGIYAGWFTPTEAAVMAVFFGLFVGFVIYRSLTLRALFELLVESAETSAVILIVVGLASVFAWATSTLGIVDPIARSLVALGGGHSLTVLIILLVFLIIVGMFLDGISIFLIFCPLFVPIAEKFSWDLVWFGVLMTYVIAMGQFSPPMAVNLMVSCRLTGASMESTVRWVIWFLLFMGIGLALMVFFPWLVLWLPQVTGFM